jgi:HEAT repeat protein
VGSVTCAKDERVALVLGALTGDDRGLQAAAVHCLPSLGDEELAKAVAARLSTFRPPVQAEVLGALGEMGVADLAPTVANAVSSADPPVRLAAVRALGRLGGASAYPVLMRALRAGPSEPERAEIEKALVAVCRRIGKATGALPFKLADLSGENGSTRSSLFHVLGLVSDAKALDLLRTALKDPSADTRLAALGALAEWSDGTPMSDLLAVARSANAVEQAAAFRGLAALAPRNHGTPEATVALLADATALAQTVEDKRALLGALAQIPHPAALKLAVEGIDDAAVANEACAAAIRIAGGLPPSDKDVVQAALTRVLAASKVDAVRTSAKQTLMALGIPVEVTRSVPLRDTGPNLALGASATSPDNLDKDGAASGDQAAIDGDPSTYWDEVDNQPLYVLRVTFKAPTLVSALRITGYQQHAYAPKDFDVLCDDKVVKTVKDAWYESNQFAVSFPPTRGTSLELRITGYYGLSPAIRELEIFNPATPGQ